MATFLVPATVVIFSIFLYLCSLIVANKLSLSLVITGHHSPGLRSQLVWTGNRVRQTWTSTWPWLSLVTEHQLMICAYSAINAHAAAHHVTGLWARIVCTELKSKGDCTPTLHNLHDPIRLKSTSVNVASVVVSRNATVGKILVSLNISKESDRSARGMTALTQHNTECKLNYNISH